MVSSAADAGAARCRSLASFVLRVTALVAALAPGVPNAAAQERTFYETLPRERPYTISLSPDGRAIELRGRIHHGITRELAELLQRADAVESLHLESVGGLVAEARGLVVTVREAGMDTVAVGDCLSVCTLVLMSGEHRYLAHGARLGFHAYRLVGGFAAAFIDAEAEQQRDMDLFRDREVSEEFIARVVATPHDAMWYPTPEELLDEKLIDALVVMPATAVPPANAVLPAARRSAHPGAPAP